MARLIESCVILLKHWRRWFIIGLVVIIVAGCAGTPSRPPIPSESHSTIVQIPDQPETQTKTPPISTDAPDPVQQRLRTEVMQWIGTPHQMGRASRQGTDCSGFVQRMYRDIFQQQIPRSTGRQVRIGQHVGKDQLLPGDLVFFRPSNKGSHVGIYLGRQEFAHASTSKGVMISSLEDDYWQTCYWTARRYPIEVH
jgi:cell wall-associated NlpC family hydrolase